jgi:phosphatidylinositol kinase/protein kinase (PI-3  family)
MAILGSDGKIYEFLLKGKEDLRQDERVMQLFGLINVCLESDRSTSRQRLNIVKYSVLPLSNNSGVIGWVQNCDTFYSLLATYRTERGIPLTLEPQLLKQQFGGDRKYLDRYDKLPSVNKVEIFQNILDQTTGSDLEKMLYWKSKTADVWVGRRDTFTRSMAVMSIVGYILGLGDRHMANIMLDRVTGTVIHIDFGDCFEINKTRSMYPETVPFRLTRMLTKCMGTSGMTGTFKKTAYRVMRVLHENRDSVMAMLEAFVYDPMVSWRVLVDKSQLVDGQPVTTTTIQPVTASMGDTTTSNTGTSNNGSEVSISDNKLIPSTNTDESESRMDSGMAPSMADLLTNTQGYSLSEVALASYADHTATGLDINSGITNTDTAERGEDMNELLLSSLRQSMTLSQSQYMKQKAHHFESQQHQLDGNAVPIGSLRNTLEAPPTHTLRGSIHGDVVLGAGILGPGVAPAMPMSTTNVNSSVLSLHNQADTTAVNQTAAEPLQENLNARALEVINRIHSKLTGRDFATSDDDIEMSVEEQVNRLIHEATSVENLASLWIGWNPWW